MKISVTHGKKHLLDFRKLTLFFLCVYVISIYLGFINSIISLVGSLSLIAMAGCALMTIITERQLKINSYVIWYSAFIVVCMISALYAPVGVNITSSLYSLIVVLAIGVVFSVAVREKKDIEIIFALMVIASALLMVYLFSTGYISEYESSDKFGRFGHDLTGNANIFAAIFMISCCTSIYFFFTEKKFVFKVVCFASFLLQLYGLVLAGSRKNILIPFIVFYLVSMQLKNKNGKYNVIVKTLIAVLVVFVGYWLMIKVPFLYDNIGYRFETVVDYGTGAATSADASAIVREAMRERALELWRQSPFFGNGVSSFAQISGFNSYSHNNIVEILCNQGILGMFTYYAYYVLVIHYIIKSKLNQTIFGKFFIAVVISQLIFEYGQVTYYMVPTHIMLALVSIYINIYNNEYSKVINENKPIIEAREIYEKMS